LELKQHRRESVKTRILICIPWYLP